MTGAFIAFLCLLLGLFVQKQSNLPLEKITKLVNASLLNIVIPAQALLYISQIEPSWGLIPPISSPWFPFLLSWIIFWLWGQFITWD